MGFSSHMLIVISLLALSNLVFSEIKLADQVQQPQLSQQDFPANSTTGTLQLTMPSPKSQKQGPKDADELETTSTLTGGSSVGTKSSTNSSRPASSRPSSRGATSTAGDLGQSIFCICPNCTDEKKPNSRFCPHHNRAWERMKYDAEHNVLTGSKANREKFVTKMKDLEVAGIEVEEYCKNHMVAGSKSHSGGTDWAEWFERYGLLLEDKDVKRTKPYEKEEYIIRQINKFGRSRDRATAKWNAAQAGNCHRDWEGDEGQLR